MGRESRDPYVDGMTAKFSVWSRRQFARFRESSGPIFPRPAHRPFAQAVGAGLLGLSLADILRLQAASATDTPANKNGWGQAKSVIMIFNLGALSQLDTFDMKPNAPAEIRGPFKPIKTNNPDIQISEIFPHHAKLADKFSLVRTCYHTAAAVHDTGHQMMQTGRLFTGGINTPHAGCALEFLKGRRNELPAHVILPQPMGPTGGNLPHGQDAGFLGKAYQPRPFCYE